MTFPTIPTVGAGRVLTGVQANTTATRTFPSLTGLTKNAGDLLIAIVMGFGTTAAADAAWGSWTGSFTEFEDENEAAGTFPTYGYAYKWSDGTETGTFSATQAATITGHAAFILMSIPLAHPSTPPESISGSRATNAVPTASGPAFDPSWGSEDTLWIAVGGSGENATAGSFTGPGATPPTGYSNQVTTALSGDVVGGVQMAVSFKQFAGETDDTDPISYSAMDTSNARHFVSVIAVRPTPDPMRPMIRNLNARRPRGNITNHRYF